MGDSGPSPIGNTIFRQCELLKIDRRELQQQLFRLYTNHRTNNSLVLFETQTNVNKRTAKNV